MKCPCEKCEFYVKNKRHPNPNAFDPHYCKKRKQAIIQHRGNAYHYNKQWIIPCGADMKEMRVEQKGYIIKQVIFDTFDETEEDDCDGGD